MQLSVKFILLITTTVMISLANGSENIGKPTVTVVRQQIATPNVPARVKQIRIVKSKVHRAVPYGMDDNDEDFVQSEDVATGYRRRDLNKIEHPDGISERVRWRLFLARQLAMIKYRAIYS